MDKLNKIVINQELATLIAAVSEDYVTLVKARNSIRGLRALYVVHNEDRTARENCDNAGVALQLVMDDICRYVGEAVVCAQIEEFGLNLDVTEDEEED